MNYKEQIYHRIELLDYFISKLTGNTLSDKSIGIMINVLKEQIKNLIEKESQPHKSILETLNKQVLEVGLIPIDFSKSSSDYKIIVADINYLLSEYKEKSIPEIEEILEKKFSIKVFLIDSSKQNMQGASSTHKPIYFI